MSVQEKENKRGCNKRVVLFFVFAILCVAAFLIVGLVKTCKADHEDKELEKEIQQEEVVMLPSNDSLNSIA
ncbi:MAG: hypothetical protein J1F38_01185 [Muribaculaceae bacterium]|nr:hypothetical protein [Muribaculaceae bacterium]